MYCRMFSSNAGLYPLNARSTLHPVVTTKKSTDVATCPLGGEGQVLPD